MTALKNGRDSHEKGILKESEGQNMKVKKYVDLDDVLIVLARCTTHDIGLYEDLGTLIRKDEVMQGIKNLPITMVDKSPYASTDFPDYWSTVESNPKGDLCLRIRGSVCSTN